MNKNELGEMGLQVLTFILQIHGVVAAFKLYFFIILVSLVAEGAPDDNPDEEEGVKDVFLNLIGVVDDGASSELQGFVGLDLETLVPDDFLLLNSVGLHPAFNHCLVVGVIKIHPTLIVLEHGELVKGAVDHA